jgi:cysteine desulfurase
MSLSNKNSINSKLYNLIHAPSKVHNAVYLDYNSFIPVRQEILDEIQEISSQFGNSSSSHQYGQRASRLLEASRSSLKDNFECASNDILFFTSGATESNNTAFYGVSEIVDGYIVGSTEYESGDAFVSGLPNKYASNVVLVKNGIVNLEELEQLLRSSQKCFVSIMLINNETGLITSNIKEAVQLTHKYNGIFHSDAAQATSKMRMNFKDLGIDLVTVSSLKSGGIVGAGALLVSGDCLAKTELKQFMRGGKKELGMRAGSPAVPIIVSFARSIEIAYQNLEKEAALYLSFREKLEEELKKHGAIIVGETGNRITNTSFISMPYLDQTEQLTRLDLMGICVSAGSSCYTTRLFSKKFLDSQDLPEELSEAIYRSGIRVSTGFNTTMSDIDKLIDAWKTIKNDRD